MKQIHIAVIASVDDGKITSYALDSGALAGSLVGCILDTDTGRWWGRTKDPEAYYEALVAINKALGTIE